ncbi:MAG: lipoyl synthase [Actinobacteria bacterium]|nr:lipoyl synthase [Actinomycetota bacterium]
MGKVAHRDADALMHGIAAHGSDDHLLLLEHPHTYTLGVRADPAHVLVDAESVGATLVRTDRGGDVTYHGPGQLVGYPILWLPGKGGGDMPDTVAYVGTLERLLIDVLADLGLPGAGIIEHFPGVWIDPIGPRPRKIAQIGVRITRGRSLHGFALNVDPDLGMFSHIVPCGITDKGVTSIAAEGVTVSMHQVVDAVVARVSQLWAPDGTVDRADVVWRHESDDSDLAPFSRDAELRGSLTDSLSSLSEPRRARLTEAGVHEGIDISDRKPSWAKGKLEFTPEFMRTRKTMRSLKLTTVCEEAGCPNISECWTEGTATFMINGDRCTRACGFCLVDTRKPLPLDPGEPERVAEAVAEMRLGYAVVTCVARDDLADGGAGAFAETIRAIRRRKPGTKVETLISDCKGDPDSLGVVFAARPDVLNHNVETVPRLQRAVRPSASYARSLAVLARAKAAGLITKSSLMVGIGETDDELFSTLADLRAVEVDIVTIGQYLRPTEHHLPVTRWVTPAEFEDYRERAMAMGFGHVESTPLTRSSHHAQAAYRAISTGRVAQRLATQRLATQRLATQRLATQRLAERTSS